jgi:hypothetical protein
MEVTQSSAQEKRKKFGWEFTKKNEGISMDFMIFHGDSSSKLIGTEIK